jgi:zinc protease
MIRLPLRTAALLVSALAATLSLGDEPLPTDARVRTGKLANGVTWMYRQHDVPPGKMALLIHVRSGSLSEAEEERGLAHFLEHMAFNGSENFPPGQLMPYFESIGMEFGRDLNAFTGFDQTVFLLFLPDTTTEQMNKGLMVLSDYAFRLSLVEDEIEKERGVVLAEQRAGMSAEQRLRDQLFEKLFAGSRLGQRLPIGLEKVIKDVKRAEFDGFYRTWYRPERVTLMLVGDAAPEPYLPLIEKWFGQYKSAAPAKPLPGPELKPFTQERALVLSDPEYAEGNVDIYNILPARPPTTTVEQARVDLLEQIGSWIIGRRFSEQIKKGAARYREASAQVTSFFNDAMLVNASAVGEPKDWEPMLDQLVAEVDRAREFGFLEREFDLCKRELLSSAEDQVRKEPTRNAQGILFEMARSVNDHEPILSAQQHLELLQKLLPTVKVDEVNRAFAANFKPGTLTFVLTMPQKEDVKLPSEDEVLAAARAAEARQVDPPSAEERPTTLLEQEPPPGKLVATEVDADLGITSGWFENGVRIHHRFMDYKKDAVLVSITLAGGQIEETAQNAGVTTVAALILAQPATHRLTSTDIQDIMTGKNVNVAGSAQDDAFTVTVIGSPEDLEPGLQLAYALLTDGKLEPSAFDNWKQEAVQQYETASKQPPYMAFDALLRAISGDDPRRVALLKPAQIEAQTLDRAQAWFERLCREAPMEVAVVGEISLKDALPLVEKYIGALPKRPRTAEHLDKLRVLKRGAGPLVSRVEVDTITPQAMVVTGFLGCEATNITDVRALNVAANILDSRLIKRVREELGLVYAIQAYNGPGQAYADSGVFFSGAPCAPDKADDVIQEVETNFQAFADPGPTAEELENAKKQIRNHLDTELKEPRFWLGQLQTLDLHKAKLADLKNIPEAYDALTAEQVQSIFKKYDQPARTFRISAVPKRAPTETQGAETKPEPAPTAP